MFSFHRFDYILCVAVRVCFSVFIVRLEYFSFLSMGDIFDGYHNLASNHMRWKVHARCVRSSFPFFPSPIFFWNSRRVYLNRSFYLPAFQLSIFLLRRLPISIPPLVRLYCINTNIFMIMNLSPLDFLSLKHFNLIANSLADLFPHGTSWSTIVLLRQFNKFSSSAFPGFLLNNASV